MKKKLSGKKKSIIHRGTFYFGNRLLLLFKQPVFLVLTIIGSFLFWSYTALFAGAILNPDLKWMEKEVREVEDALHKIEKGLEDRSQDFQDDDIY